MRLQIEKAVYGGAGLGHQAEGAGAGQTVFVPFALPTELVEVELKEQKDKFGEASLVQVLMSSEDRVKPRCAHFGECGGCDYQNANYSAQVQMKVAILQETLQRAGLTALPQIQRHMGEPWGYRNRTRLRIEELEGVLRAGYNRRASNQFLAIHECPILTPLLWRATEALLQLAAGNSAISRWVRRVVEVEFFTTEDENKLQMTVFAHESRSGLSAFCEQMQHLVPELTGATLSLLSAGSPRQAYTHRQIERWGAEGLVYHAAGENYWVNLSSFFQVNRFLIDKLVEIVTARRQGKIAWDLYAGAGLFSRVMAKTFEQVVAVGPAANDLMKSFHGSGRRAVQATTVDFLRGAVIQRERPDLVVMDPPRAGVGAEVCALLARVAPPELVYVSCDPVTLSRDLSDLIASGYSAAELHMVDMFPQTFHLETVVVLRR